MKVLETYVAEDGSTFRCIEIEQGIYRYTRTDSQGNEEVLAELCPDSVSAAKHGIDPNALKWNDAEYFKDFTPDDWAASGLDI